MIIDVKLLKIIAAINPNMLVTELIAALNK